MEQALLLEPCRLAFGKPAEEFFYPLPGPRNGLRLVGLAEDPALGPATDETLAVYVDLSSRLNRLANQAARSRRGADLQALREILDIHTWLARRHGLETYSLAGLLLVAGCGGLRR